MLDQIRIKKEYPYPPDRIWFALTDTTALEKWFLPNDFVAEVGSTFTFRDKPAPGFDGIIRGEVLTSDPPERLVYTWRGGSIATEVEFNLSLTTTGGTLLHLEHRGFSGLVNKLMVRNILALGWRRNLLGRRLPAYLADHA